MNNSRIIQDEIIRRRDMRDVLTFTIDPADAKDFDDALSFQKEPTPDPSLKGGEVYRIGVHIADVSFYVKPGTYIDDEAYKRGTSVYLVDRVMAMLPEELCNDVCSLRPDEDKLCMSVVFTMDADAKVLKHKICRTVIRSNARLNYDEALAFCLLGHDSTTSSLVESSESPALRSDYNFVSSPPEQNQLIVAIQVLNNLAKKLRAERIANGALTIEQDEMRFHLDKNYHPTDIYFERPNEAHHLIEEFMLLANRTVAKSVGSGRPFVYRVHDLPDSDKLDEIQRFVRTHKRQSQSEGFRRAVDMLTIRAQAKAVYSTHNIGHYGLAFSHYTHFTSPIRRYPDLMVHRLVDKYILSGKGQSINQEELELMCEHCSACEQDAQQAERDSVKMFQAMWMEDHVGEVFRGYVSGITDFGLFIQLEENRCEGLIHISNLEGKDINSFVLGDDVTVKVAQVNINRGQIDFLFA